MPYLEKYRHKSIHQCISLPGRTGAIKPSTLINPNELLMMGANPPTTQSTLTNSSESLSHMSTASLAPADTALAAFCKGTRRKAHKCIAVELGHASVVAPWMFFLMASHTCPLDPLFPYFANTAPWTQSFTSLPWRHGSIMVFTLALWTQVFLYFANTVLPLGLTLPYF